MVLLVLYSLYSMKVRGGFWILWLCEVGVAGTCRGVKWDENLYFSASHCKMWFTEKVEGLRESTNEGSRVKLNWKSEQKAFCKGTPRSQIVVKVTGLTMRYRVHF